MRFEISSANAPYNNTNMEAIAAISKENARAASSDFASVYEACIMDIDAAVMSISDKGVARINAMLSRSIQLSVAASTRNLSPSDRQSVTNQINHIRMDIDEIQGEEEASQMVSNSTENILKHASESIKTQSGINSGSVLQLL